MTINEAITWLKFNECCIITENNPLKLQLVEWLEELKTYQEIMSKAHCEDADCFECAFGSAEGCLLKEKEHGL